MATIYSCPPAPLAQISGAPDAPTLVPTYAASIALDPSAGAKYQINAVQATSATCTLTTSTAGKHGQLLVVEIKSTNSTTTTFSTGFSATATAVLTNGQKMTVTFMADSAGTFNEASRSIQTPSNSNIVGTTTNNNATAGNVGEFVQTPVAVGAPVSLTTGTAKSVANVSLTAGDWDVEANLNLTMGSATTAVTSAFTAGISATDNTLPTDGSEVEAGGFVATTSSFKFGVPIIRKRVSIATTTTIYLVGLATFSAGTAGGYGVINARRVR